MDQSSSISPNEGFVDPSDEAEAVRYFEEHPEEVNTFESSIIGDFHNPRYGPAGL